MIQKIIRIILTYNQQKKEKTWLKKMPKQPDEKHASNEIFLYQQGRWYRVCETPSGELKKGEEISLEEVPLKFRNPTPSV